MAGQHIAKTASIADADAVATDWLSTVVVVVAAAVAGFELWRINQSVLLIDADQFFAVSPSKAKRIGVPPLLRTESATLVCLWDRPY